MCVFVAVRYTLDTANGYLPDRIVDMVNHATGSDYTPESLLGLLSASILWSASS